MGKDRRKVGKKLSQRGLGAGGPLEVRTAFRLLDSAAPAAATAACCLSLMYHMMRDGRDAWLCFPRSHTSLLNLLKVTAPE